MNEKIQTDYKLKLDKLIFENNIKQTKINEYENIL